MQTYYDILGVDTSSSREEIKRAFRRKAKQLHPDVSRTDRDVSRIHALIQAYETLGDPLRRAEYDRTHFIVAGRDRFDYRRFLKRRTDDPHSQSKLIFFDLLHNRPGDALETFEDVFLGLPDRLEPFMDREDFMDCSFLLSEEYERRGEYLAAYRLLARIAVLELERAYFKHFFEEVINRLRNVVCVKMTGHVAGERIIGCLEDLLAMGLPRKHTAFFFKKAAELYLERDDAVTAGTYLKRGLELDSKLAGAKKIREKIAGVAGVV
ncbi:MAG: J domain-containing protein [Spirochaetaceae bacterium]